MKVFLLVALIATAYAAPPPSAVDGDTEDMAVAGGYGAAAAPVISRSDDMDTAAHTLHHHAHHAAHQAAKGLHHALHHGHHAGVAPLSPYPYGAAPIPAIPAAYPPQFGFGGAPNYGASYFG